MNNPKDLMSHYFIDFNNKNKIIHPIYRTETIFVGEFYIYFFLMLAIDRWFKNIHRLFAFCIDFSLDFFSHTASQNQKTWFFLFFVYSMFPESLCVCLYPCVYWCVWLIFDFSSIILYWPIRSSNFSNSSESCMILLEFIFSEWSFFWYVYDWVTCTILSIIINKIRSKK